MVPFHMLGQVSYLLVYYISLSVFDQKYFEIIGFKNAVTLKSGLGFRRGH